MTPPPEGFVIDENPPPEGFVIDEKEQPRTKSEQVWRDLKLTGRIIAEAPALVLAGMTDFAATAANVPIAALDYAGRLVGDEPLNVRVPVGLTRAVEQGWTQMTGVEPETRAEKYAANIYRTGQGIPFGVGGGRYVAERALSPVTRAVGQQFATSPGAQAVAATSGAIGATRAEEAGYGPTGQMVAGIGAAALPAAAQTGTSMALRGAVRGGAQGRQQYAQTADDFQRAGMQPSVAQASQGRVMRAGEVYSSRMPGGAGRTARFAEQQADDMAAHLENRASQLAAKTSAQRAGRTIISGITRSGGFVKRFRARQRQLFDALDQYINPESQVSAENTMRVLDDMAGSVQGAENLSGVMANQRIRQMHTALLEDASANQMLIGTSGVARPYPMPYQALKGLRTVVAQNIENIGLGDDITRAQWKRLYGALSDDMRVAVMASDDPAAIHAFNRANAYTRAGHARLDTIDPVLRRAGGPEKVFVAAMAGTKEGNTVLHSLMQSLKPEQQRILSATVIRRMGLAAASQQDELGARFSTETFLTNWNKLSPSARTTLFNRYGASFRRDMDRVARVAANLREGSQVFRNPSGTAQAGFQQGTIGAFALGVMTGQWEAVGGISALVLSNNIAARLMQSPNVVNWLARSTRMPMSQLPAQLQVLSARARETGDEELALLATVLEETQNLQGQEAIGSMPELQ